MTRITGRAAFLQLLVDEGVSHLFGNPGTTELPIMEVVPDFPQLKFVLGLQEGVVIKLDPKTMIEGLPGRNTAR